LRQMFVLGNSEYLLFSQTAQSNAIFQRDHEARPVSFSFRAKLHFKWDPLL
jgi:hypothetical protein